MSLLDTSVMQQIADSLGQAYGKLIAYGSTSDSTSPISLVIATRGIVETQGSDADFQASEAYATTLHGIVASMPNALPALLLPAPHAIESYVGSQGGVKTRIYFKSGLNWSDNFRSLWRQSMNEELIVRLAYLTNSAGSWSALTLDKTIGVDSALQIIVPVTTKSVAITLSLTLHHAAPGAANEVLNFMIPPFTPSGTVYPIGTIANSYVSIASATISGGSGGDNIEVWVI